MVRIVPVQVVFAHSPCRHAEVKDKQDAALQTCAVVESDAVCEIISTSELGLELGEVGTTCFCCVHVEHCRSVVVVDLDPGTGVYEENS